MVCMYIHAFRSAIGIFAKFNHEKVSQDCIKPFQTDISVDLPILACNG